MRIIKSTLLVLSDYYGRLVRTKFLAAVREGDRKKGNVSCGVCAAAAGVNMNVAVSEFTMKHPKDQDGEAFGYMGALASSIEDVASTKQQVKPAVMTQKKKTQLL